MISSDTKFFPEEEAAIFEKQLFNFWQKGIDKRWFWLAFQALQNSGLTYFESEKQEMEVRERIVLLSVIYYEYCLKSQAAECPSFNGLSRELICLIKKDFSDHVNTNLFKIRRSLINYFGDEKNVVDHLWINRLEGETNRIIRNDLINSAFSEPNWGRQRGEDYFMDYDKFDDIKEYEGMLVF